MNAATDPAERRRAWRIPEADIARVKKECDLAALVRSRGIELRRHGANDLAGKCPFHEDQDTPNFIVSPGKGLWHCMACGVAGNAIQFVEKFDGVSFRHAFEMLAHGGTAAYTAPRTRGGPVKNNSVPRLACPLDAEADDAVLMGQVLDYYQERLWQSSSALEYLERRGLKHEETLRRFRVGFADRSLGLRLPESNRQAGATLRERLTRIGLWRDSGHEHFNGCIVVPIEDEAGRVAEVYGRRLNEAKGGLRHLYLPGPHGGIFNHAAALAGPEVILCEAIFDTLTFIANGIEHVTTIFGTEGFTDELFTALRDRKVRTVRLAYDADEAGERAAKRDTERLRAHGMEVYRIKFPWGMDVNEYARKVTPAAKSLGLLIGGAEWVVSSTRSATTLPPQKSEPSPANQAAISVPAPASSSLAASLLAAEPSVLPEEAAKKEKQPVLTERDGLHFLSLEEREYRLSGLEKCIGLESLKITLRLRWREYFHGDAFDLCRDQERRRFVERASEETGLTADLLKRDLGRLLLAVEQHQEAKMRAERAVLEAASAQGCAAMSTEEEAEALALLRSPDLLAKIATAFEQCGVVGEDNNKLTAYLACVSRLLERPLAVIIQSTSAAGKSTLMDAVLSFFPEEERVKYSAMTGQSLYYLGETNLRHKILAIVEEEGAEKASYALKLLQSEGELTIASTGKDPHTGRMVTQEYHVEGPVMIFLTTTAIDLDEELQNRCLTLAVDESPEQTARIHTLQRQRRTLAGLIAREERKDTLRVLRNAQRLLTPLEVLNPFAPALTFEGGRTRTRRDHEKYLTLIDSLALLHQHQRTHRSHVVNGRTVEYIEVTLDDIAVANRLAPEVLGRSLDELPPQTRRLYGHVRELVRELMEASTQPQARCWFSRRQLREKCGWSEFQTRVHLQRLEDLEYLARRFGRQGVNCAYELLLDVDGPEEAVLVRLIDVADLATKYGCDRNFEQEKVPFVPPSCAPPHEAETKQPSASVGKAA
jgi:DNA primase catalytic core